MRSLSRRAVLGLIYLCGFFALMTAAVAAMGVIGVRSTAHVSHSIVQHELINAAATAELGRSLDAAHVSGNEIFLMPDRVRAARAQQTLYNATLPRVDSDLANLQQLHSDDPAAVQADLRLLASQWVAVRTLLTPAVGPVAPQRARRLDVAFAPLNVHVNGLITSEATNAAAGDSRAAATSRTTIWLVGGALALMVIALLFIGRYGVRRIRRAVEPENQQLEFAETLQMTDSESEAHDLLKRHLERSIPGTDATVLIRNNSADRLDAMTALTGNSPLRRTLQHADPRSCLAIRAARPYTHGSSPELLGCSVCGDCPGRSACTPLTVSGEVIGSVLVSGPDVHGEATEQRIRDSVVQAAPVLANLRNLAIAELRASTDSLTGLANKRAVTDTLKRMVAHASRSLTPMSMLMIDLDHFKRINDQLGHPIGDQALANVGAAIAETLRTSDFAGRNGGEEFVVLLPDTPLEGAIEAAERIRVAVAEISLPGLDLTLSASIGVAVYPDHAATSERLERLADSALYTAKRSGRNRIETADPTRDAGGSSDQSMMTVSEGADGP